MLELRAYLPCPELQAKGNCVRRIPKMPTAKRQIRRLEVRPERATAVVSSLCTVPLLLSRVAYCSSERSERVETSTWPRETSLDTSEDQKQVCDVCDRHEITAMQRSLHLIGPSQKLQRRKACERLRRSSEKNAAAEVQNPRLDRAVK